MIRPETPFLDNAATWNPRSRTLTVQTVRDIDPEIKSIEINLNHGGDIHILGIDSKKPSELELSTSLQVRALTERRARKKLAKQQNMIDISTSSEKIVVTQQPDKTQIPNENRLLLWKLVFGKLRSDSKSIKMDVSLRTPTEKILYSLHTNEGTITAANISGKNKNILHTNKGTLAIFQHTGDLRVTSGDGDVHVIKQEGDLMVKAITGDIKLNAIKGHINAQTQEGDIEATQIKGVFDVSTEVGNIKAKEIEGSIQVTTDDGDIEIKNAHFEDTSKNRITAYIGNISVTALNPHLLLHANGKVEELDIKGVQSNLDMDNGGNSVTSIRNSTPTELEISTGYGAITVEKINTN